MSTLGFEPEYAPEQSHAPQLGLLLLCLVPASTPEAVPIMMARAIAVLVNMGLSPSRVAAQTLCSLLKKRMRQVNQPTLPDFCVRQ